ncbi:MAG: hypothetical protein ACREUW_09835 [Burkholderiales bacterium]
MTGAYAPSAAVPLSARLGAWLLVAVIALVILAEFFPAYPDWITGVIAWAAVALFWPRFIWRQRAVVIALTFVGALGIAAGMAAGAGGLITRALAQNTPLTGMLVAVSFLQLVTGRPAEGERLEKGPRALASTLAGVHLFGAVINYSAVAIFAERLAARRPLALEQAVGLSQAFIIGALWSPFYGSMAMALTFAPRTNLLVVMAMGVPLTLLALALTWATLSSARYGHAREFEGYPLRLDTLWVPAVLAVGVLIVHAVAPQWSVLAVIAALAPLVTFLTLLATDGNRAPFRMRMLVETRVPEMGGEMALFVAAGVLSAGMAGVIAWLDLALPFTRFGGGEAALTLALIVFAAWLGFHPIIPVSVLGPWIAPLNPDPNLLSMTCIMGWGIGLTACPMSNTLLAIRARYGVSLRAMLAANRRFSFVMLVVCAGVLVAYAHFVPAVAAS